ncbi:MAG: hypothetical protein R3F62_26585 [Planctomycetota bacterium]
MQWAARLGHPLAQTLCDAAPDAGPGAVQRCLEAALLTPDQRHRFALDCVQRVMPILGRSLPSQVVPQALSALSRGPSLISDLASVLPNLPPLSRQRSSVVFQCYRAVRAALEGDAPAASQAAVFARRAEDQPEELEWQREHLAELLLE